jgi:hypothetical protein
VGHILRGEFIVSCQSIEQEAKSRVSVTRW